MNPNLRITRALKAYENQDFITSPEGRTIRMLSEYLHPSYVFEKNHISGTIVFFGSARILSQEEFTMKLGDLNDNLSAAPKDNKPKVEKQIARLMRQRPMTEIYQQGVEIAERISKWSLQRKKGKRYFVMTGGGPGMMEAANRGAYRAGAPSIGLNISLPFEQYPNQYLSEEFNFEFHYFFMRKYWFISKAKAFVTMPGGLGTLDELIEILTLIQTTKVQRKLPIVLYKEDFWKNVINFDYLIEQGMINECDLQLFKYCNTPDETFEYLTAAIVEAEEDRERQLAEERETTKE